MRKHIALLVTLLLLFTSTAGCIHIHLAKDLFAPRKEEKVKYEFIEYEVANHSFTSNWLSMDPTQFIEHYEGNETVEVIEGTEHMRFDIKVTMRSAEEIWEQINDTINLSQFPNVAEIVEILLMVLGQRYIEIIISMPDGTEWYRNTTRVSMETDVFIPGPETGEWMVEIEGDGIGGKVPLIPGLELQDSFVIDVLIKQPKQKK